MFLTKLIDRIAKTSAPFDPALQQFLSPDQRKIEDELRLIQRAEKAGRDNTPKPDSQRKDALALEIDTSLNRLLRNGKRSLQDHLNGLAGFDSLPDH